MPLVDTKPVQESMDKFTERACSTVEKSVTSMLNAVSTALNGLAITGIACAGIAAVPAVGNRLQVPLQTIMKVAGGSAASGTIGYSIRCSQPPPPICPVARSEALALKPVKQTLGHANELLKINHPMPDDLAVKLQLKAVKENSLSFFIKPEKGSANEAFKNELMASGLPDEVVKRLNMMDFTKSATNCKVDEDFVVQEQQGRYYWYSLRSSESQCFDTGTTFISIALMMTVTSFEMCKMVDRTETITEKYPVYETELVPTLKHQAGILFGAREYEITPVDKVVGYKTETKTVPVFREHAFSPEEVKMMKQHMVHRAASEASMALMIE